MKAEYRVTPVIYANAMSIQTLWVFNLDDNHRFYLGSAGSNFYDPVKCSEGDFKKHLLNQNLAQLTNLAEGTYRFNPTSGNWEATSPGSPEFQPIHSV